MAAHRRCQIALLMDYATRQAMRDWSRTRSTSGTVADIAGTKTAGMDPAGTCAIMVPGCGGSGGAAVSAGMVGGMWVTTSRTTHVITSRTMRVIRPLTTLRIIAA